MSYGLIQDGRVIKNEGMSGLSDYAKSQEQREQTNKGLKTAKKAQETTAMISGATSGAMLGSSMAAGGAAEGATAGSAAGPWGAVIGAGIGLLAGWALS